MTRLLVCRFCGGSAPHGHGLSTWGVLASLASRSEVETIRRAWRDSHVSLAVLATELGVDPKTLRRRTGLPPTHPDRIEARPLTPGVATSRLSVTLAEAARVRAKAFGS